MIKEISVRPKPQNNNAKILFLISMLIFLLGVVSYFVMEHYKGIVGLFAIGFLTVGILTYTKFISPVFYYDITEDSEGTPIFVVRRIVGKRQETLARVDLADIRECRVETREERKKYKTPVGVLKYNYCPTLSPKQSVRLALRGRFEKADINVELSEEFAQLIMNYAEEARSLRLAAEADEEY